MLRIAPIVEGHGEVSAVPELLRRIGIEYLNGSYIDILKPIRQPRSKLLRRKAQSDEVVPDDDSIASAAKLASIKLAQKRASGESARELILLLLDSNGDCAAKLAPTILVSMNRAVGDSIAISVVLAVVEYETWFVAAADSILDLLNLADSGIPADPEVGHLGKGWIERAFRGHYSETVDQVRLTAKMDLARCRARAQSFDKLCRELERWAGQSGHPT